MMTGPAVASATWLPLGSRVLVGLHRRSCTAGTAHSQLHGQDGHAHGDQKQQVEQHEHAAAVLPRDCRGSCQTLPMPMAHPALTSKKPSRELKFSLFTPKLSFFQTIPPKTALPQQGRISSIIILHGKKRNALSKIRENAAAAAFPTHTDKKQPPSGCRNPGSRTAAV